MPTQMCGKMSSFLPFSLGHPGRQLEEVQRGPTQEHPHGPPQGREEGGGVEQEVLLLNQNVGRVEVDLILQKKDMGENECFLECF